MGQRTRTLSLTVGSRRTLTLALPLCAHGVVSARPWMEPRWYGEGGEGGGEAAAGSGESEQSTP